MACGEVPSCTCTVVAVPVLFYSVGTLLVWGSHAGIQVKTFALYHFSNSATGYSCHGPYLCVV